MSIHLRLRRISFILRLCWLLPVLRSLRFAARQLILITMLIQPSKTLLVNLGNIAKNTMEQGNIALTAQPIHPAITSICLVGIPYNSPVTYLSKTPRLSIIRKKHIDTQHIICIKYLISIIADDVPVECPFLCRYTICIGWPPALKGVISS